MTLRTWVFGLVFFGGSAYATVVGKTGDHGFGGRVEVGGKDELVKCRRMADSISNDSTSPYSQAMRNADFHRRFLSTCTDLVSRRQTEYVAFNGPWGLPFDPNDVIGEVFKGLIGGAGLARGASEQLYSLIKGFQHGKGFGVSVQGGAVVQGKAFVEGIVHDGEFGLFCGGGAGVMTDVGVGADAYGVQSFGCKNNKAYSGGFLSFGLNISFELAEIPAGVGGALSFGIDLDGFAKRSRPIVAGLVDELGKSTADFHGFIGDVMALAAKHPEYSAQALLVLGVLDQALPEKVGDKYTRTLLAYAERVIQDYSKKSKVTPSIAESPFTFPKALDKIVKGHKGVAGIVSALVASATGCNAISVGVGAQLSVSPVSVSAVVSDYYQLGGFDVGTVMNAPNLANPIHAGWSVWNGTYQKEVDRTAKEMVRVVEVLGYLNDPGSMVKECAKRAAKANIGRLREVIGK